MKTFSFYLMGFFIAGLCGGVAWAEAVVTSTTAKEDMQAVGKPCMDAVKNQDDKGEFKNENLQKEFMDRNPHCVEWWKLITRKSHMNGSSEPVVDTDTGEFNFEPKSSSGISIDADPATTLFVNGQVWKFDEKVPYTGNVYEDGSVDSMPQGTEILKITNEDGNSELFEFRNVRIIQ